MQALFGSFLQALLRQALQARQYLYFCTSKVSNMQALFGSILQATSSATAAGAAGATVFVLLYFVLLY
jgi:hypothetical protein